MKQGITLLLKWFVAVLFSVIGIVNCFVGNDPEFGVFIFAFVAIVLSSPSIGISTKNRLVNSLLCFNCIGTVCSLVEFRGSGIVGKNQDYRGGNFMSTNSQIL